MAELYHIYAIFMKGQGNAENFGCPSLTPVRYLLCMQNPKVFCATLRAIPHIASRILSELFDLLFPIECLGCGEIGRDICDRCIHEFRPAKRQHYDWLLSLGNYRDPTIKKILWHIKKLPNERAAGIIAKVFARTILNRPHDPTEWTFVPIPITRKRFRERGFNQSLMLAQALGAAFDLPVTTQCLVKHRETPKQGTASSRAERKKNVIGSFRVDTSHTGLIAGKNVILVDDVTTTGSTLAEARSALLEAGARRVLAWTVAN